ncbi:MAG: hypothetical protein ACOYEV_02370 [Candidatus Nanopelagicales bacterium]
MSETENVQAYIRTKQTQVLRKAVDSVRGSAPEQLKAQTHRYIGTLSSFALTDAAAALRQLHDVLSDPEAPTPAVEAARAHALDQLGEISARFAADLP